ncbi:5-(carboxyamino)imidazole ribonucleotide synthase [Vagococcus zengguangii]|uniref:5-(carboxyamino)imidazole ribonucleotide synthase n=1 Tax=Vagococcus zengguangii TaxID=2571750 RepID=UPI001107B0DA|nr:5-(carboxyamino)imidazole ribonucleotide synthase [Vagococcus zengguangii]TLG81435.1 5-(carboxyamino)imidazole ribonucleotide synthase [Vagococcus zengguangii]
MNKHVILPGAAIGIIGGGQLGQMLAMSAKEMGYRVNVLDPNEHCPASCLADTFIHCAYDNVCGLTQLANCSDILTYEFENVSAEALKMIDSPNYLPQGTALLEMTQNRVNEKRFLQKLNLLIADFQVVTTVEELDEAVKKIGYPCVLKTATGGYDGKGQVVIKSIDDLAIAATLLKQSCVLEEWLTFDQEISVIVAGNIQGDYVTLPCGENIHQQNILHQTIVPARVSDDICEKASQLALKIAQELQLTGVLAIEMFVVGQQVYVNELAPRPHNSGHYSIEACDFSQFDLHIKGVCGLPLSKPHLLSPVVMTNILGQHLNESLQKMMAYPTWHFHYYGKEQSQIGRKMGHVTILTDDVEKTLAILDETNIWDKKGDN